MEFSDMETTLIEQVEIECAIKDAQLLNDLQLALLGGGTATVLFS